MDEFRNVGLEMVCPRCVNSELLIERPLVMNKLLQNIPKSLRTFIAPQMEQLGVVPVSGLPDVSYGCIAQADGTRGRGNVIAASIGDTCLVTVHTVILDADLELLETPNDYGCICSVSEAALGGCPVYLQPTLRRPRENLATFLYPKGEIQTSMKAGKVYSCASIILTPEYMRNLQWSCPGDFDTLAVDLAQTPTNELPCQLRPLMRMLGKEVSRYLLKTSDRTLPKTVFSATELVAGSYAASLEAEMKGESEAQRQLVTEALRVIETNLPKNLAIEHLAEDLFVSRSYLCAAFKKEVGMSIGAYVRMLRMERAAALLNESPSMSVAEVATCVGYGRQASFTEAFAREMGCTPSRWRKENRAVY